MPSLVCSRSCLVDRAAEAFEDYSLKQWRQLRISDLQIVLYKMARKSSTREMSGIWAYCVRGKGAISLLGRGCSPLAIMQKFTVSKSANFARMLVFSWFLCSLWSGEIAYRL